MSDILIKGMEMPKERESFTVTIKYNGLVFDTETMIQVAEAQEIPPHGRCIDADALLSNKGVGTQIAGWGKMFHETAIEYAPTIIPAEEVTE